MIEFDIYCDIHKLKMEQNILIPDDGFGGKSRYYFVCYSCKFKLIECAKL